MTTEAPPQENGPEGLLTAEDLERALPSAVEIPDDMALRFLDSGEELYSLQGLTEEDLEALYTLGNNLYEAQTYGEAREIFEQLCLLNGSDPRFWFALGCSLQPLGRHEEALAAFAMAQSHEEENPLPAYQAYECHLALGDIATAAKALLLTVALAEGSSEHASLAKRAATLLEELDTPRVASTSSADA
jgi:type III secretion system low calcium response chaperone LcrH/SycD